MSEVEPKEELYHPDTRKNKTNVRCSRCSCLILKPSIAQLINKEISLQREKKTTEGGGEQEGETLNWFWHLPDMWLFENIAFTKAMGEGGLRYLTCADCEQGVIGIQPSPTEFYLALSRVHHGDLSPSQ
eukprot:TRINITY_DN1962_c0_g1_i1.p1 TRINITY_DN1962_c0_g1~~TRINITY_DN1962_c0_g1_i1.p1  ORF type:complete len:150 (-),score=38.07 TRINITY_DN1962_c0_g1_i1:108-494(-)